MNFELKPGTLLVDFRVFMETRPEEKRFKD